jgi:serine/threonine protein kinase
MITITQQSYFRWLSERGIAIRQQGPWASHGVPTDDFHWKIHISSTQIQAFDLLDRVIPLIINAKFPFKVALDDDVLAGLNEGVFGPTQIGKFITIYPPKGDAGLSLTRSLIAATAGFTGPHIVTDLHLGNVVYVRYGSHNPNVARDRLGNITLTDSEGRGGYSVPFIPPAGIDNPFASFMPEMMRGQKTAPIGPGYLLLSPLSIHPKGSVYLGLDVRKQEAVRTVVIKEGRRHCLSDRYGRDICDRLYHQKRLHDKLQHDVPIPHTDSTFVHLNNVYLPLEFIEGEDLVQRSGVPFCILADKERCRCIDIFKSLIVAVEKLHLQRCVHRDLSPRNVRITQTGQVMLIDLEMAYDLDDLSSLPFMQGTIGFLSPQQLRGDLPATTDDIYSIGCLIAYVITGLDTRRFDLITAEGRSHRLAILSGAPEALIEICHRCLDENPALRPTLQEIDTFLSAARLDRKPFMFTSPTAAQDIKAHASNSAMEGVRWILSSAPCDSQTNLWTSPEIESSVKDHSLQSPHAYRLYRSTNRGVSGIVYALARATRFGIHMPGCKPRMESAVDWLLMHVPTPDDQMPGLHFGEAGVAVAIAETIAAGLIDNGPWLNPYIHQALSGPLDWPDMTHGAAGQGLAALIIAETLQDSTWKLYSARAVKYLLQQQAEDGSWPLPKGAHGLENVTYTGFAHGTAGIIYFLAAAARLQKLPLAAQAARRGGEWLQAQCQLTAKSRPFWTLHPGSNESWNWWCHGAPGIALAFLELFRLTNEFQYAEKARAALLTHPPDLRYPNLSQCHGLAGYGEMLLSGFYILKDQELLDRSVNIANILIAMRQQQSDGVSWLVENPYKPTADLMIGNSGVIHFLARIAAWERHELSMPLHLS